MVVPERPNLLFFSKDGSACLELDEMKDMLNYVIELELELKKARTTVEAINESG